MTHKRNIVALAVVAMAAFVAGRINLAPTQQASAAPQDPTDAMMEQMQAMMEAGTPGEHHKYLNGLVGEWEGKVKIWMSPDAMPLEAPCTISREWVLEGRFVREVVQSSMGPQGTFEGIGYTGYNNFDGQYEMIWMENMATGITIQKGTFNPETGELHTFGEHRDPATGHIMHGYGTVDMSDNDRHTYAGYLIGADG